MNRPTLSPELRVLLKEHADSMLAEAAEFERSAQDAINMLVADDAILAEKAASGGNGLMSTLPEASTNLPNPTRVLVSDPSYPEEGTNEQKMLYAIRTENRFLHRSQIISFLEARQKNVSRKSIGYMVSHLFTTGKTIRVTYNGATNMIGYGLPEMVRDNKYGATIFADRRHRPTGEPFEHADRRTAKFESRGVQLGFAA